MSTEQSKISDHQIRELLDYETYARNQYSEGAIGWVTHNLRVEAFAELLSLRASASGQEAAIWQARDGEGKWVNCTDEATARYVAEPHNGEIRPLYASPVETKQVTEHDLLHAVLSLPHTITGSEIVLRASTQKPGNATAQLSAAIATALSRRALAVPEAEPAAWSFDRFVNGRLMAEGVTVEHADNTEKAMQKAASLAAKGPNKEVPVLVLRSSPSPQTAAVAVKVLPLEPTAEMRSAVMDVLLNSSNIYTREGEETIVVETYTVRAVYDAIRSVLTAALAAKEGER